MIHRLVHRLGIDAVQGHGDADHRAQEAHDGNRPNDHAEQPVAGVQAGGVEIGQVFQLVVEPFGRAEPADVLDRRPQAADIRFLLPSRGKPVELARASLACSSAAGPSAATGPKRRLPQPAALRRHVEHPEDQCGQADGEHQRFGVLDRMVGEVASDQGHIQRPAVDESVKQHRPQRSPQDGRAENGLGEMIELIHRSVPSRARGKMIRWAMCDEFTERRPRMSPHHRPNRYNFMRRKSAKAILISKTGWSATAKRLPRLAASGRSLALAYSQLECRVPSVLSVPSRGARPQKRAIGKVCQSQSTWKTDDSSAAKNIQRAYSQGGKTVRDGLPASRPDCFFCSW